MKTIKIKYTWVLLIMLVASIISGCKNYDRSSAGHSMNYLMSHLTEKEKIDLLGGVIMSTTPVPRLGIPSLRMDDGPVGVRWGKSTSFPSGIAMASTWDTALIRRVGQGIGREVRGKGRNIILGPNVNIARNPLNGRTFEAFGEDPFLTSAMGVSYIKGVQEEGVGATVKHFVANSQEYHRHFIDEKINERTLHEIYFPAFKAAVQQAHVVGVMAAYNKVNGEFCSANDYLLNTILRKKWGYKGLIMSDWTGVHNTFPTINNGLDLEMPTGKYLNTKTLLPAIKSGKVNKSTIDEKVRNILKTEFRLGLLPTMKYPQQMVDSLVNAPETRQVALQTAEEGIVLLKNEHNQLPINLSKVKSIAVIGPNAAYARTVGGGSSEVRPIFSVSPLQALRQKLKGKVAIHYAPGILFGYMRSIDSAYFYQPDGKTLGLKTEYFDNDNFSGRPILRTAGQLDYRQGSAVQTPVVKNNFKGKFTVRWTGKVLAPVSGNYVFRLWSVSPATFSLNHQKMVIDKRGSKTYNVQLKAGEKYDLKVDFWGNGYNPDRGVELGIRLSWKHPETASIANAVNVAKHADVAIVFAGTSSHYEHEGGDRSTLELPENQNELIYKVSKANPHTIVVLTSGAPVTVQQWINQVPSVLETWFDGEYIGTAITEVLLGHVNPSGKLPITFPKSWSQEPLAVQHYRDNDSTMTYSDGIYVGYRYFDTKGITSQFPFGFGLSYTTYKYSDLKIENHSTKDNPKVDISFKLTDTGSRAGAEVAQVYVHEENPKIDRPLIELKGFVRVKLSPGESKVIHLTLTKDAFKYWSPAKHSWVIDPNTFDILVGSSSAEIHLKGRIKL